MSPQKYTSLLLLLGIVLVGSQRLLGQAETQNGSFPFWKIRGNTGTNSGTHFLGTTDFVSLRFRTNNTERAVIDSLGNVGIGIATPSEQLTVYEVNNSNKSTIYSYASQIATGTDYQNRAVIGLAKGGSATWGYSIGVAGVADQANSWYATGVFAGLGTAAPSFVTTDAALYADGASLGYAGIFMGGNVGIGTANPAYKLDNVGLGGANIDVRTTGRIWTNSTDGGMWLSNLQDCFMGNINTSLLGFWTSSVGWNALNITKTTGYVGIGTMAPASRLHVVDDADNRPVIYGINTNTSAGTTSFGVRGECNASGLGSAGISGVSTNSGQNEIGVLGDYSLWGASVFGLGWAAAYADMTTGRDYGVFGTVNFPTGTGVYGFNWSLSGAAYGVYCNGNFAAAFGFKAASVPTSQGNQLLYCMESPEIWFEEVGHSQLINGKTIIQLDPLFLETVVIDKEHPMEVFTQEKEETNGLLVLTGNTSFEVREKSNGTSNATFSYRILAKRKYYQDHRFGVDANQPLGDNRNKMTYQPPITTSPDVMKAFVDNVSRQKEDVYAKEQPKTRTTLVSHAPPMKNPTVAIPVGKSRLGKSDTPQ